MRKLALAILAGAPCAGGDLHCRKFSGRSARRGAATVSAPTPRSRSRRPRSSAAAVRRRSFASIRERAYLPPTAVRACDAWYEQEFRPSGTVIVPRMRCRWVAG